MLRWRDSSASMYMVVMSRSSCLLVSSSDSTPANLNGSELNSYKFIVAAMFSTAYSVYLHGVPIKTVLFRRILHKRDTCNALVSITCKTSTTSLFLDDCKSSYSTFLKLSFFLSDLNNNFLKYTTLLSLQPTLLAILALFLMNTLLLRPNLCTF